MKLIFSCSPGRCGTELIAKLFSITENILSRHEPEPSFSLVMQKGQVNEPLLYDFVKNKKIPYIIKDLEENNKDIYLETSHLFCKGFLEIFLKLNIVPDLFIIERNYKDIAKSLFSLGTIPGRSYYGLKFCLSPNYRNIILRIENCTKLTDFELCYWYVLEMYKRAEKYSEIILKNGGNIFTLSIDYIKKIENFDKICRDINAGNYNKKIYNKICRQNINSKDKYKKKFISDDEANESIERINRILYE